MNPNVELLLEGARTLTPDVSVQAVDLLAAAAAAATSAGVTGDQFLEAAAMSWRAAAPQPAPTAVKPARSADPDGAAPASPATKARRRRSASSLEVRS